MARSRKSTAADAERLPQSTSGCSPCARAGLCAEIAAPDSNPKPSQCAAETTRWTTRPSRRCRGLGGLILQMKNTEATTDWLPGKLAGTHGSGRPPFCQLASEATAGSARPGLFGRASPSQPRPPRDQTVTSVGRPDRAKVLHFASVRRSQPVLSRGPLVY